VPALIIAPLATFVLALSSVRTRRSASAMAMFGGVITLLLTILVAFGLARQSTAFVAAYRWFSMSIAFNGPTNFQNFEMDLILRVDHLTVLALLVIEVIFIAAIGWHQVMGRAEPGAARFHAVLTLLLFTCVGILVSADLVELLAFWAMAGAVTYILLTHRWGADEPALRARVALALPFVSDLCLLFGVGWFYARYGVNTFAALVPILHTNPGWTERSIVFGSALLFAGVAGRLTLWPLTAWITRTGVTAPPAAWAIVQAVWSIAAVVVLYRLTPIFIASNTRTLQVMLGVCTASAVITALLSLVGNEPRRVIALAASSASAVGAAVVINSAYHSPAAYGVAGVAAVLVVAPARVAVLLAIAAVAGAMRTDDLVEMGEAWRRMRSSAATMLTGALLMGLAATGALAYGMSTRSGFGLVLGEAVLLLSAGGIRVFFGASFGVLRRRRGFDPERMREPHGAFGFPYWLLAAAAVLLGASLLTPYLDFLDGKRHPAAPLASVGVWVVVALVGFAACSLAYWRGQDSALGVSAHVSGGLAWLGYRAYAVIERFLVAPSIDIARRYGGWVPGREGALGRVASAAGQLAVASSRAPALPILVGVAVVLALVLALAAPGIAR
jgi:NADH:ubiquinone oxidoreductase subunit 5 (subunit L)/multisubunit Na+/H+ antiporter MnhA subunit